MEALPRVPQGFWVRAPQVQLPRLRTNFWRLDPTRKDAQRVCRPCVDEATDTPLPRTDTMRSRTPKAPNHQTPQFSKSLAKTASTNSMDTVESDQDWRGTFTRLDMARRRRNNESLLSMDTACPVANTL
ncbi:Aste57867_19001 [Aphanomyces stellatus]|uniref:Aste57867_19001 protein n=1 Tax=Aphanomyces stellatus TaxID=120398 RepID=A0A485LFR9_9STRA|nr:hypothetical protein As57867_018937 [Aphanomyces stellatus]VFT95727.1 Aste57867_19001 [Aphanomyces stellatus]